MCGRYALSATVAELPACPEFGLRFNIAPQSPLLPPEPWAPGEKEALLIRATAAGAVPGFTIPRLRLYISPPIPVTRKQEKPMIIAPTQQELLNRYLKHADDLDSQQATCGASGAPADIAAMAMALYGSEDAARDLREHFGVDVVGVPGLLS